VAAWFNKKTAEAMAKMAESLKSESLARAQAEEKLRAELESKAAMERKVKAEAEKMLLSQYSKYNAMVERAEAKAKEAMARVGVRAQESEDKVHYYAAALAQAEENLSQAIERIKTESIARVRAEEMLKSESEERKRFEAQFEDALAAAKAKEEEKVHSQEVAVTKAKEKVPSQEVAVANAQEKRIEAKGQVRTKAVAKVKHSPRAGIKKRPKAITQSEDGVHSGKRNRRGVFHQGNIKRKIILLLVLMIFSALTFAFNVADEPSVAGPGGAMTQEQAPAPDTLAGRDTDGEQLKSDAAADISGGSMTEPAADMTNAPALNYGSEDNVTIKVNEVKSVPVSEVQSLTITANPVPLKLTAPGGGTNNVAQSSDNNRRQTSVGSKISYDFSGISIPANAVIRSVVLFVEHFEEERFAKGKLEWSIGTGWPGRPVVWALMKAPVYEGESRESVDAWDITSFVNTAEKINSLQLQIKNNNNVANGKTFVDYAYVVIKYH
jgi:chemotaxis protein histidine kinase CheA